MYAGQKPDLLQLGAAIRERRKGLGLTQVQLAERLGWSQERVSVLETGRYGLPSLPLLAHLAEALELPLSALMEAVGFRVQGVAEVEPQPGGSRMARSMDTVLSYTLQRLLGIQALTMREAMMEASDLVAEAMGADKIDLFLLDPATETLVAMGTSNTPVGRRQARVGLDRVPLANGGRQAEVFLTGREYYSGHAEADPEIEQGIVRVLGLHSIHALPLLVNGAIRGIVVAGSERPERFSEAERDFLRAACQWIGVVAHRAELQEAVARQTRQEVRRQVAEEMLETVAHDLGNQITPIKGEIDLLLRRIQQGSLDVRTGEIERISRSLGRLGRQVNELLDASRLEGGIFSLSYRPVDLIELVRGVVDFARSERAEIQLRAPETLRLEADAARLTQALQNLIGNALQHTPAGVPILVRVQFRSGDQGTWAVIEVQDEGPGIAPEIAPRLFRRYAAGGASTGLGLGLYLAHGIAAAHGGELTVHSEAGKGTTFTLTLPLPDNAEGG